MSAIATIDHPHHAEHAHDDHGHKSWIWRYVFSTDHKVIGLQYGLSAMIFLLFGFFLMMVMRWSIAFPGQPMPVLKWIFSDTENVRWLAKWAPNLLIGLEKWTPEGRVSPELYNMFGAMHGT